ncbi:MAG: hypothetical protein ACR2HR_16285 [Euzebya sp.]
MDLEDLLEDLLDNAAQAARRGVRRVATGTAGARRGVRRVVRATSIITAITMLSMGLLLLVLGDPGAIRTILGVMLLGGGTMAAGTGAITQVLDRRDPVVQQRRAERRGELPAPIFDEDLSELPRDVRHDFSRLLQARRLNQDLAHDGWVSSAAVMQADSQIARLHGLLVTDRRAVKLGGEPSGALRQQVSELADLLVALADEALHHQIEVVTTADAVAVTLDDARENLIALRQARREVRDAENRGAQAGP